MAETKTKKATVAKKTRAVEEVTKTAKTKKIEGTLKATKETPKVQKTALSGLSSKSKQELIQLFATKDGDTGSPEVQVALATHKVFNLTAHLEQNPKDNHSRRGLLKVISKRRRILNYLAEKDEKRYKELIKKLELKK